MKLNIKYLSLAILLFVSLAAKAEDKLHVGYVFPAGGKLASKFEVVIGGQKLGNATAVYVNGYGIQAKILRYDLPEWMQKKKDKEEAKKSTSAKDSIAQKAQTKKQIKNPKRQQNSQIDESLIVEIDIDSTEVPGEHELRVVSSNGISNPLKFWVGGFNEIVEAEPNDKMTQAELLPSLPVTINGQIVAGDVDWFRVRIKKGEQVVFAAKSRELMPYLADAVPGWFQAALTLCDSTGREVAYADHNQFEQDPVISFKAPKTEDYFLQVRDMVYRGREDFVYRISIEDKDKKLNTIQAAKAFSYKFPRMPENESNNDIKHAQRVELPTIINGAIQKPGDWDVYSFKGVKNQQIVAEVNARKIGSHLDSILKLTDSTDKVLISNDDFTDKGEGLVTHQADSYFTYKLPSTGTYYLHIGDVQNNGGKDYAYQLRISQPMPDFELFVTPSGMTIPNGGSAAINVSVIRKEGFNGEILLALKDTLSGIKLDGALIPADKDQIRLTISLMDTANQRIITPQLAGSGIVANTTLTRDVIPVDEMMQAFSYKHLVPAQTIVLAITEKEDAKITPVLAFNEPIRIPAGGSVQLNMDITRQNNFQDKISIGLDNPPKGISAGEIQAAANDSLKTITIKADKKEFKVGYKGNLILTGRANKKKIITASPAIPFIITSK
jgi:hypothetical protein